MCVDTSEGFFKPGESPCRARQSNQFCAHLNPAWSQFVTYRILFASIFGSRGSVRIIKHLYLSFLNKHTKNVIKICFCAGPASLQISMCAHWTRHINENNQKTKSPSERVDWWLFNKQVQAFPGVSGVHLNPEPVSCLCLSVCLTKPPPSNPQKHPPPSPLHLVWSAHWSRRCVSMVTGAGGTATFGKELGGWGPRLFAAAVKKKTKQRRWLIIHEVSMFSRPGKPGKVYKDFPGGSHEDVESIFQNFRHEFCNICLDRCAHTHTHI